MKKLVSVKGYLTAWGSRLASRALLSPAGL